MKDKETWQAIAVLALMPVVIVVRGLILAYGWNTYLPTILPSAPLLNWAQAFGIVIIASMTLPNGYTEPDQDVSKQLAKMIVSPIMLFLTLWLIHFGL